MPERFDAIVIGAGQEAVGRPYGRNHSALIDQYLRLWPGFCFLSCIPTRREKSMGLLRRITALVFLLAVAAPAWAVPVLQIYIEGAVYDQDQESWTLTGGGGPVRLWTIGNVSGPGGAGTINDVRLSIAYAAGTEPVTITLTPSTTGGYGGFFDPSTPGAPTYLQTVTDGSSPLLSDNSPLPAHGIYGTGTVWQEYLLGHFTLSDSPIADFIDTFPTAPANGQGQINVYEVTVSGTAEVHFDLYDSVASSNHARFAPFSHDGGGAGGGGGQVPQPGTAWLLGAGVLAALLRRRKR